MTETIITVRVKLRATFNYVGADPYGLAGGAVGSDVVERHGCGGELREV